MTSNIGSTFKKLRTIGVLLTFGTALIVTQAKGEDLLDPTLDASGIMSLRSDIRIDGEFVTIGDLFHMSGEKSALNVVRAPSPGARLAIPAGALARFAARQGLSWENGMRLRQVMVTRNSTRIELDDIKDALELAFEDMGLEQTVDLRLNNRNLVIHQPAGTAPDLSVETLNHDAVSGRFVAEIRTPSDNGETLLTSLSGQTIEVQTIPILAHPVPRGEIITAADLKSHRMPISRMGANVVTDIDDVIGMQTKRALRPGQPLRTADLKAPTLIKKGAMVTMTFAADGLKLTNIGRAMETGGAGDIINVLNPRSRQTVMARITGSNRVSVALTTMQIASNE